MRKTIITAPLHLNKTKTKKVGLSMNNYRTWHFHVSNKLKKDFKEAVRSQLEGNTFDHPCIEYFMYYPDNRRHDKMNFAAVISKFFLDAMTEFGCIPDDNDDYIGRESIESMGVDKENPRCEIIITEL